MEIGISYKISNPEFPYGPEIGNDRKRKRKKSGMGN